MTPASETAVFRYGLTCQWCGEEISREKVIADGGWDKVKHVCTNPKPMPFRAVWA